MRYMRDLSIIIHVFKSRFENNFSNNAIGKVFTIALIFHTRKVINLGIFATSIRKHTWSFILK